MTIITDSSQLSHRAPLNSVVLDGSGSPKCKVEISDLHHSFQTRRKVVPTLLDINLTIRDGEFVCLVGPSGCGKTTILNVVAGLLRPTRGDVKIDGESAVGRIQPGKIGYMLARDTLLPWATARENAAFGLAMHPDSHRGRSANRQRLARADEMLAAVGLAGFGDYYPSSLSHGMRQRVSLARTLLLDPDILLMDEPFSALDAQTKRVLEGEFLRIWEQSRRTVLFVTHDLVEAIAMGDRVVVLEALPGRIKREYVVDVSRDQRKHAGPFNPRLHDLYESVWNDLKTSDGIDG